MIENRPIATLVAHLTLIIGVTAMGGAVPVVA